MKHYMQELVEMAIELNTFFIEKKALVESERSITSYDTGKEINVARHIKEFEESIGNAEYHTTTVSNFRKECEIIKSNINAL